MTPLTSIYDIFLDSITDDMYMEITKEETHNMLFSLLQNATHWFEFPRFNLYDFDAEKYNSDLTLEEMKILATYMIVEWFGQ